MPSASRMPRRRSAAPPAIDATQPSGKSDALERTTPPTAVASALCRPTVGQPGSVLAQPGNRPIDGGRSGRQHPAALCIDELRIAQHPAPVPPASLAVIQAKHVAKHGTRRNIAFDHPCQIRTHRLRHIRPRLHRPNGIEEQGIHLGQHIRLMV
ncbi:MAG: hypothetical protein ACK56I_20145, partial [bacterium]